MVLCTTIYTCGFAYVFFVFVVWVVFHADRFFTLCYYSTVPERLVARHEERETRPIDCTVLDSQYKL